ncbi:MAG: DUF2726 domain-containing protein [Burkholderiales bacterium]
MWYLLLLALAGGVVFAIWNFRRKTIAKRAASEARFEKMFKERAQLPATPQPKSSGPSAAAVSTAPAKAPLAAAAAPPSATQRFLGQAESLLYYLLKAGLPDCEVFAGVSLARVVGAAGEGRDREQQVRRLSQYQLDFVICDKSMRVVAVVDVESAASAGTAGDQRFKSDILGQAGIRLVRVNPAALPRREQLRALISGGPPQKDE